MSNKTRKHIWPGALVMSIAIVGALAAFRCAVGRLLGLTEAHDGAGRSERTAMNSVRPMSGRFRNHLVLLQRRLR